MTTALIIGHGQIGQELAAQLSSIGIGTKIATRSGAAGAQSSDAATAPGANAAPAGTPTAAKVGGEELTAVEPVHVRADATDRVQLRRVAEGADVIFACAHAPYDSRKWEQILPALDRAALDVAAELAVPVVFPESVYAFAALGRPITESSPFAPADEKGRIRQRLLEAREAHPATSASVIAGDLLGRTAEPSTSVVRMCITDPISHGRRAFVPARTDVAHGITVIADLAAAMIRAAQLLADVPTGTHRLLLAPASHPTLAEIAEFSHKRLGSTPKRPLALPRWSIRVAGFVDRSMYEVNQLAPIWYAPCVIEEGELAATVPTTDWREGVKQML